METHTHKIPKYTLSTGVHDTRGRRNSMEDTHVVIDEVDSLKDKRSVAYYGCFDGHGGVETARMIAEILHTTVFKMQEFLDGNVIEALEKAFEVADKIVVSHSLENNYVNGCTAVVGVVVDGFLYIANIGDSEGILISVDGDKATAENLTFAHKASVPSEKARIESLGGYVFFNRVFGSLAVSRAFGDSKYKQPKTTQNYVSYLPATKTIELNKGHKYLLLACDGLWDVCTHSEVANIVHEQSKAGKNPQEIASFLCTEAIRKRSEDNITVILTKIDWVEDEETQKIIATPTQSSQNEPYTTNTTNMNTNTNTTLPADGTETNNSDSIGCSTEHDPMAEESGKSSTKTDETGTDKSVQADNI